MKWKIRTMRKASREMDATFALEVLDKAPYITVSMTKSDGSPFFLSYYLCFLQVVKIIPELSQFFIAEGVR